MEGIGPNSSSCTNRAAQVLEKKARPQEQLNCPRCNSTNTKFCYYNNYSLTQPRYFCKTCRRYWTEGGTLRNVPVGGGSRKNKKIISTSSSPSSTSPKVSVPDLNPPIINPKMQGGEGGHDLNLAFPAVENNNSNTNKYHHHHHHGMSQYIEMAKMESGSNGHCGSSAVEMLRSGMGAAPNYVHSSLMPTSNSALFPPAAGFPIMQEIKPNLGLFSIDALDQNRSSSASSYGVHENSNNNNNNNNGRLLFPFGEMKQLSAAAGHVEVEQINKDQGNSAAGYWAGMIGEGSSW